jgi:hypothetical protein
MESPAASTAAFKLSDTGRLNLPIRYRLVRCAPSDAQRLQQNGISRGEDRGFQVVRHWTVEPPDPALGAEPLPARWE